MQMVLERGNLVLVLTQLCQDGYSLVQKLDNTVDSFLGGDDTETVSANARGGVTQVLHSYIFLLPIFVQIRRETHLRMARWMFQNTKCRRPI